MIADSASLPSRHPSEKGSGNPSLRTSSPESTRQLADTLAGIESLLIENGPASLESARIALEAVEEQLNAGIRHPPTLLIAAATARGHWERSSGNTNAAITSYASALTLLDLCPLSAAEKERRASNLLVCQGLALLSNGSPESLRASIAVFDRAIALREGACRPLDTAARWGLAATWMNRADALFRLGTEVPLRQAVTANERAIDLLAGFDLNANAAYRLRLALAWMNRSEALTSLDENYSPPGSEALGPRSFLSGIEILRTGVSRGQRACRRMLAVLLSNLARARLRLPAPDIASIFRECGEALSLLSGADLDGDIDLLRLDLTTRVTWCRALLSHPEHTACDPTEVAEIGLERLLSGWSEGSLPESLLPAAGELFRCGAEAYLRDHPRFLAEYLLDHLDPCRSSSRALAELSSCHKTAVGILWRALGSLQREGFSDIGSERFAARMDLQREWQSCRECLAAVRDAMGLC